MSREHPHVTGDGKLCAPADGISVKQCDHGNRKLADGIQRGQGMLAHRDGALAVAQRVEFLEVAASGEAAFTRPAERGHHQRRFPGIDVEALPERAEYGLTEGVTLGGTVYQDLQNAFFEADFEEIGHAGAPLKKIRRRGRGPSRRGRCIDARCYCGGGVLLRA